MAKAETTKSGRERYAKPAAPARLGLFVVICFVAVMIGWGAVAPLSGASIAEGSLQVQGRAQAVQHPHGGVVRDLRVAEGDVVSRGDVLIVLDDIEARSRLDVFQAERRASLAALARLGAEREQADEPAFPEELTERADRPEVAELIENERAILTARRNSDQAAKDVIRQRIAQLDQSVNGIDAQIEGLERRSALLEEEAEGARRLLDEGFAPRTRVMELEGSASELLAELETRRSEKARAAEAIGEAQLEIAQLERDRLSRTADEVRGLQSRLAELGPQIEAATDALRRTEITAPATGQVVRLSVFTEGGVIAQGAHLLDIMPVDNPLYVEARLSLRDISQIRPGHVADIRLVSSPRNQRPKLKGRVTTVSADRITDERSGAGYYALQIAIDAQDAAAAGVPLQAGMAVEVILETEPRTFLTYLTGPLFDEMSTAFRED